MIPYRHRVRRLRKGQTLILVAMLIIGIMAFASLVIDLGYARLAQRQMQTAADGAALEGLRQQDTLADQARREAARDFARLVFDDDLDDTDDPRNFGAGPIVEFSGGVGDPSLNASQTIEIPAVPVHKPELELNLGNDPDGDMIASNGEFTVQIRRTGDSPETGVRSSGPTSPLLFGRGALLLSAGASDPNSIWNQGIRVRATANARAYPAMSVGPPVDAEVGALPFAIFRTVLESSSAMEPTTIQLSTSGFVTDIDLMSFGQLLERSLADPPANINGYAPVVEDDHVFGFVYLQILSETSGEAVITPGRIADVNATTTVVSPPNASSDLLARLFETHSRVRDDESGNRFLLAPALAPSIN